MIFYESNTKYYFECAVKKFEFILFRVGTPLNVSVVGPIKLPMTVQVLHNFS